MLGEIKNACHPEQVERLRGWLEEARQAARDRLLDVPAEQPAPTLVLPVDQAEELFNADAGPEAPRFLELLAALVAARGGGHPGDDRGGHHPRRPLRAAADRPELAGVHTAVFDDLKPMPPAGYTEVITGPARRATAAGRRLTIEPALVERLLAETAEGADALPLLALTLERLYRDFGGDGDLTVAEYESMGGMAQVVQTEVDKLLAADPEQRQAQLDTLHDAFIPWLATINPDNDQPMRRLARWDDLPAASHPLIQAMVDKRLLVKDTRDGQTVVEVALESLLRQWHELAGLAARRGPGPQRRRQPGTRRRRLAGQRPQRILAAGRHPAGRGRNPGGQTPLPRPPRTPPATTCTLPRKPRENDRNHASARGNAPGYSSRVLAVTAIIAVVAVILGVQANDARNQADARFREATSLRLVSEAQSMLAGTRSGGAVRAFQQLVVARRLAQTPDDGPLLNAL